MNYTGQERRKKPRTYEPFQATVRGVDRDGGEFEVATMLENISAGGLYMRLARQLEPGAKPFIVLELPLSASVGHESGRIALRTVVMRTEPQPNGSCGVAAAITSYRFL